MRVRATLGGLLLMSVLVAAAWAAAPRGNANYIAQDSKGRPGITLWMQTKTRMIIFTCYNWGPGPDHGDHLSNKNPIAVTRNGSFSYSGPAVNEHFAAKGKLTLSGHFASRDLVVGTITDACMKHHRFSARFAP